MTASMDYGMGLANRNPDTGIRYGVVSLHSLAEWVFDEFFHNGRNLTMEAVEADALAEHPEWDGELPDGFWDYVELDEEEYELETDDGLRLGLSYLGGAPLVWVYQSPQGYNVRARLCSPCIPGAGDLDNLDPDNGEWCYGLPPEWWGDRG